VVGEKAESGSDAADASEAVAPIADRRSSPEETTAAPPPSSLPGGVESESINAWPDESAESAMLSELRSRGEAPAAPAPAAEPIEETTAAALPKLDALLKRIPPEVRETLEDLFRAKFVTVRRIPKKALK
jgi:hypothetical protein